MKRRAQAKGLEGWAKPTGMPRMIMESVPPTHIHPTTGNGTGLSSSGTTLGSPSRGTIRRLQSMLEVKKEEPSGYAGPDGFRPSSETHGGYPTVPFMKTPRSGFEPEHPARQAGLIDR